MIARMLLRAALGAAVLTGILAGTAAAQEPQLVGTFRDWTVFTYEESGNRVCYMVSQPKRDEGNYTRRGDIYTLVTQRPAENSFDVVTVIAGYTYQEGSDVTVEIGGQRFNLFTAGENAWARDEQTDKALTDAIRRGSTMIVRGISSRGTATTDTYSLAGSAAAYEAMNEACGISR